LWAVHQDQLIPAVFLNTVYKKNEQKKDAEKAENIGPELGNANKGNIFLFGRPTQISSPLLIGAAKIDIEIDSARIINRNR
jgi:hypothetical protein